jgi:integrase
MKGASPSQIQAALGHSSIQMAMRYTHLTPESKESVFRLLDGPRILQEFGENRESSKLALANN